MTSQPGNQTIAMHILPNISKSKDNQTMEKIFLYRKCGRETIQRSFSKKPKLGISLDQ